VFYRSFTYAYVACVTKMIKARREEEKERKADTERKRERERWSAFGGAGVEVGAQLTDLSEDTMPRLLGVYMRHDSGTQGTGLG